MDHRSEDTDFVRSVGSPSVIEDTFEKNISPVNDGDAGDEVVDESGGEMETAIELSVPENGEEDSDLPQCKIKRNYSCSLCPFFSQNPRSFLYHSRDVHFDRIKIYECSQCLYASKHSQKLQRHINMIHVPGKTRKTRNRMIRSDRKEPRPIRPKPPDLSPEPPVKVFTLLTEEQKLKLETESTDEPEKTTDGEYKCSACNFKHRNPKLLRRHEKIVHLKKRYLKCSKCSYVTHVTARFTKHVKYHSMPMIKCDLCDFRTPYKWNLDRHYKNHSGSGAFQCAKCNFRADIKQSLTVHEMNHHSPPVGHGAAAARKRNKVGGSETQNVNSDRQEKEGIELEKEDSDLGAAEEVEPPADRSTEEVINLQNLRNVKPPHSNKRESSSNNHLQDDFIHPDDIVPRYGQIFVKNLKCKFCSYKAVFSHEIWRHEKRIHGYVRPENKRENAPKRPPPQLIPIQNKNNSTAILKIPSVRNKSAIPSPDVASHALDKPVNEKEFNEMCKKSSLTSSLKDFVSLIGDEEGLKTIPDSSREDLEDESSGLWMSEAENSDSKNGELSKQKQTDLLKKKNASFFDKLKEKLLTVSSEEQSLFCEDCGHESKCLSEAVAHQKRHSNANYRSDSDGHTESDIVLSGAELSSTRCQHCRQRCKTSTDLINHLKSCKAFEASLDSQVNSEDVDEVKVKTEEVSVESDSDVKLEEDCDGSSMENRVFVWNDLGQMHIEEEEMDVDAQLNEESLMTSPGYGTVTSKGTDNTESGTLVMEADPRLSVIVKKVFKCPHCSFWASTASRFHVHIVGHLNKKPFECSLCMYRSNWRWDITKHIRLKSLRDPSHSQANVNMTDETGRRNYSKYNRFLTMMRVQEPTAESSGYGRRSRCGDATQGNAANKDILPLPAPPRLTRAPVPGVSHQVPQGIPLRPPPPLKAAHQIPSQSSMLKHSKESVKKTFWKCKKCNFRDTHKGRVLLHVKKHYMLRKNEKGSRFNISSSSNESPAIGGASRAINSGVSGGINSGASGGVNSGANSGVNSGANSGVNSGAKSGINSGAKNGINSGAKSGINSGANSGVSGGVGGGVNSSANSGVSSGASGSVNSSANSGVSSGASGGVNSGANSGVSSGASGGVNSGASGGVNSGANSGVSGGASGGVNSGANSGVGGGVNKGASSGVSGGVNTSASLAKEQWLQRESELRSLLKTPSYSCGHCHQVSNWKHVIQRHCKLKHNGDALIEVKWKGRTTAQSGENQEGRANEQAKSFSCDICPFTTDTEGDLTAHKLNHVDRPGSIFKCTYCPFYVPSKIAVLEHMEVHGIFDGCDLTSLKVDNFDPSEELLPEKTGNKRDTSKKYKCLQCPYISNSRTQFLYHKQFHRPRNSPFKCLYCTYNVSRRHLLHQHLRVHHNRDGKPYDDENRPNFSDKPSRQKRRTEQAQKELMEKLDMEDLTGALDVPHIPLVWVLKAGNIQKMYKCRWCPHVNARKINIQEHEKMHQQNDNRKNMPNGGSKLHCSECNYTCNNAGVLASHVKVHQGFYGEIRSLVDPTRPESEQIQELQNSLRLMEPEVVVVEGNGPDLEIQNPEFLSSQPENAYSHMTQENKEGNDEFRKILNFCDKCPGRFFYKKELRIHSKFHMIHLPFRCTYCTYTARQRPHLLAHYKVHSQEYQNKTQGLIETYAISPEHPQPKTVILKKESYVTEGPVWGVGTEGMKKSEKKPVPKHACHRCPATFFKTVALQYHLTLHGGSHKHKCKYCDYTVKTYGNLMKHQLVHERNTKEKTEKAKFAYSFPISGTDLLQEEVDMLSEEEKAFDTPEFNCSSFLKKVKVKEKKYKCEKCPSAFQKRHQFEVHVSLHGSKQKYRCEQCDYSVKYYANYAQHIRKHDNCDETTTAKNSNEETSSSLVKEGNEEEKKTYELTLLEQQTLLLQERKKSVEGKEEEKKIYCCGYCPHSSNRRDVIENHSWRHFLVSGIKSGFECSHCDYSATQSNFLREHIKLHFNSSSRFKAEAYLKCEKMELWCCEEDAKDLRQILIFQDRGNEEEPDRFFPPIAKYDLDQNEADWKVFVKDKVEEPSKNGELESFDHPDSPGNDDLIEMIEEEVEEVEVEKAKPRRSRGKNWRCKKCPHAFGKKDQYLRHVSLHGSNQRHNCDICDYSVKFYTNYVQHMRMHQMHEPNRVIYVKKNFQSLLENSQRLLASSTTEDSDACLNEERQNAESECGFESVDDENSENLVIDESSENLVNDESSENLVIDESSENLVIDESSENLVIDESSENLVIDENSENLVVDENDEGKEKEEEEEEEEEENEPCKNALNK